MLADEPVDELGAELRVPPRRVDLDVPPARALDLAQVCPLKVTTFSPACSASATALRISLWSPRPAML